MALIDITPIMTSDTTPAPYVASASGYHIGGSSYDVYKAFDEDFSHYGYWCVRHNGQEQWVSLDFGKKVQANKLSSFFKATANFPLTYVPSEIKVDVSNDGVVWKTVVERTEALLENDEFHVTFSDNFIFRYIKISMWSTSTDYVELQCLKILFDDSLYSKKEKRITEFKSPVSINGYVGIKNTDIIPDAPKDGIKLFIKEGKIFRIDETGTQSEVGSGSSVSGKVVTGIGRGQDKIVISFSDGTQEEVAVVTDLTEVDEEIQKTKSEVSSLKIRSHSGEKLDYGFFKPLNDIPLSAGAVIEFDNRIDGNIECIGEKIQLKAGRTYKIGFEFTVISDNAGGVYLQAKDAVGNILGSASSLSTTYSASNASPNNSIGFIYTAKEDAYVYFVCDSIDVSGAKIRNTYSYMTIEEIGRTYYHNEVKSVDEKDGIQDTPVGHIMTHIGLTIPKHYLACDGKEYNIVDYPKLAEHFLNEFGYYNYFGGDGINTFAVPNMKYDKLDKKLEMISLIPVKTSQADSHGKVFVSTESNDRYGWYAFDGKINTSWTSSEESSNKFIGYEFNTPVCVREYSLKVRNQAGDSDIKIMPKDWKFEGHNGTEWVTLDTIIGETWTIQEEEKKIFY